MPQLPFEILDGILEEGLKVLPLSSLSSLALTSRGFRIYANEARFSTLLPYKGHVGHDCDGTIRRLDSLADVIRTGHSIPTLPGVGDFVTSFQLKVTGYATALQRVLDSQSIPFIFANIFRPSPLYTSVNKPRSLMLSLHPFEWGYSSDVRIHWSMLDDGFRGEFANLLCLSDLDELHLRQIKGIPSSFLQGSKVKHLNFRGVSLQSSVSGKSAPINLQSLSIDHFISFQDLVQLCFNSSFSPPPQSFRSLTNASLQVNHAEDMDTLNDILSNAPHIQHLGILLHYMGPNDSFNQWAPIQYQEHSVLKEISISSSMFTALSVIIHLLGDHIPQSLEQIQISRVYRYDRHMRSAQQILTNNSVPLLANHLVLDSFDSLMSLVVAFEMCVGPRYITEFDANNFERQCRDFLVTETLLSKREDILQVRVSVSEEI